MRCGRIAIPHSEVLFLSLPVDTPLLPTRAYVEAVDACAHAGPKGRRGSHAFMVLRVHSELITIPPILLFSLYSFFPSCLESELLAHS